MRLTLKIAFFWTLTLCLALSLGSVMAEAPVRVEVPADLLAELSAELLNAKEPSPGVVTGGQPSRAVLERAAALGFGTVINLRGLNEDTDFDEPALVESLGMDYVSVPIADKSSLSAAKAEELALALSRAEGSPVLLHCGSGNRVGALLALVAFFVDGLSAEQALEVGERSGLTSLMPTVEALLAAQSNE